MRITQRDPVPLDGVPGVALAMLAPGTSPELVRVDLAILAAGSSLPKHPAGRDQTFCVVSGQGEVAGDDDARVTVGPGTVVDWEAGELHTTWATTELTAIIVQRREP